jgi:formylglycine-generating enzyme required for sulfatase activity
MAMFCSSFNAAAVQSPSSSALEYETIAVPEGSYTLHIPEKNFFEVSYLTKQVTFEKEFYIGKYEVSNRLWNLCFQMQGCTKPATIHAGETLDSPAVRLNWHDAFQFSQWFSKQTGHTYRLPTEEEWAYTAYMGKDHTNEEVEYNYANIDKIRKVSKITHPSGTFPENAWGFADYQGNVWEWTLTCWYASAENILKERSIAQLNSPNACTTRIAQGENRSHIPDFISDTYNGGCATLRPAANLGFRLVRE